MNAKANWLALIEATEMPAFRGQRDLEEFIASSLLRNIKQSLPDERDSARLLCAVSPKARSLLCTILNLAKGSSLSDEALRVFF